MDAIKRNDPDSLVYLLKLGKFEFDTSSQNGSLLHSDNGKGVHKLMKECIRNGAVECLASLREWVEDSRTPFTYDYVWLIRTARIIALRKNRWECFFSMVGEPGSEEKYKDHIPPPETVWAHVLTTTPSPNVLLLMLDVLPFNLDLLHPLVSHCSRRESHPAIVDTLLCNFDRKRIDTPDYEDKSYRTPLAAAASALNVPAMTSLLRNGAQVVVPYFGNPSQSPLISAVLQHLPSKPTSLQMSTTPLVPTSTALAKMNFSPYDYTVDAWRRIVAQEASLLRSTVANLVGNARAEMRTYHRGKKVKKEQIERDKKAFAKITTRASITYLYTLRTFLQRILPWLLRGRQEVGEFMDPFPKEETALMRYVGRPNLRWSELRPGGEDQGKGPGEEVAEGGEEYDMEKAGPILPSSKRSGRTLRKLLSVLQAPLNANFEAVWSILFTSDTLDEASKVLDTSNVLKAAEKSGHDGDPVKILYELLVAPDNAIREKYCMVDGRGNRVKCLGPFHDYCELMHTMEMAKIERER